MRLSSFLIVLALSSAGCSPPNEPGGMAEPPATAEARATAGASGQGTASASATATSKGGRPGGGGKAIAQSTPLYEYELSYPAVATRIPALAARIEADATGRREAMAREAREAKAAAGQNGQEFRPHGYGEKWEVVADLPGFLSLSNAFHSYSGGAHGMYGTEALVWDKGQGRALNWRDLFTSPGGLQSALGQRLCTGLDAARRAKGVEPPAPGDDSIFPRCPSLEEATVLLGSSNGRTFNRITVYYGPYVAGPYAEGEYEVHLPVDAQLIASVRLQYRGAFTTG